MTKKHSDAQRARFSNPEQRQKQSEASQGIWADPERRRRQSEIQKQRWADPELRERQRQIASQYRHTEERKRKISEGNTGKKMSDDARANMSAAKKGKPASEATRQRLLKGARKPKSPETRQRMSEGQKALYQNPEYLQRRGETTRKFWAGLTDEEKTRITRPGRLACLEAVRLRTPTRIETAVAQALTQLQVTYEQQVLFRYYVADIYLPDFNTVIECDGDYWHSTPKMKAHDKKRDKWFANHGITVIRLKECDIRADTQKCVEQALKGFL